MQRNPIYLAIYAAQASDSKVHNPKCSTKTRSPRVYQGVCDCGWTSLPGTGSKVLLAMKSHALASSVTSQNHAGERG